jgi:septal ring factor EnvC (AmiA/AmiB activator)
MSEIKPCLYCQSERVEITNADYCICRHCGACGPAASSQSDAISAHNEAWARKRIEELEGEFAELKLNLTNARNQEWLRAEHLSKELKEAQHACDRREAELEDAAKRIEELEKYVRLLQEEIITPAPAPSERLRIAERLLAAMVRGNALWTYPKNPLDVTVTALAMADRLLKERE